MIMVMVSGTPSALVVLEPKLDVMSLRTMPLSVSTSPGYGPAVSSGSSPLAVSLVSPLSGGAPPPGAPLGAPSEPGVAAVSAVSAAHAPRVIKPAPARPAPATSLSMPRRSSSRGRS
jgi:hypothetical protein